MAESRLSLKPELWGGIECTINRIGDTYRDQLLLSGHYDRPDDISHFTSLGIEAIRYPVLWEKHEHTKGQQIDWSWTRGRLEQFRDSGVAVIAGLLHHGSGPPFTDLLDANFPKHLESYASSVAENFPWITDYTPVNEPLTTARFSGLYGFWYPHHNSDAQFLRMFINQMKGIVLAIKAIRKINPGARLIQTEDLGKTHSTPLLRYQADFENERRWLTYDLLCGRITRDHPMWGYLTGNGVDEASLYFFMEHSCVPAVAGMNYYVTSERFLDEQILMHPRFSIGGNARHTYADVEAVRVIPHDGLGGLLREAWHRYGLPMAVTEVHMSCTREEQMRWFQEAWNTVCTMREENIDVQAITAWSLLGSFDWNSLLTRNDKHYESGVFDISSGVVRATALATQITSLATLGNYQHPLLNQKGWWNNIHTGSKTEHVSGSSGNAPPLIIWGNGRIKSILQQRCIQRNIPYVVSDKHQPGNVHEQDINAMINTCDAWGIVVISKYPYDPEDEIPCLIASLSLYHNIQYMSLLSNGTIPENLPRLVDISIDLLIDRVSGRWNISEKGTLPLTDFRSLQAPEAEWQYLIKDEVNS